MKTFLWSVLVFLVTGSLAVAGTYECMSKKLDIAKENTTKVENRMKNMWPPQPQFDYDWENADSFDKAISDWKTFSSEKYNFSIKYPSTWMVNSAELDSSGWMNIRPIGVPEISGPIDLSGIFISVVNLEGKSFNDYMGNFDYFNSPDQIHTFIAPENVTLAGGAIARYDMTTAEPVPAHEFHIDAGDKYIYLQKVMAEYSQLTKDQDNEAIGIINSIIVTK